MNRVKFLKGLLCLPAMPLLLKPEKPDEGVSIETHTGDHCFTFVCDRDGKAEIYVDGELRVERMWERALSADDIKTLYVN
jgi:hypothetical protein